MNKFFSDLNSLQKFTAELDFHSGNIQCEKCKQHGQYVPHDYIYQKQSNGRQIIVGKRILCSNRYGRTGCGMTLRLYLSPAIPSLQYNAETLSCFLCALIAHHSIQAAYKKATHCDDPRNAYRWLNKLYRNLSNYRTFLKPSKDSPKLTKYSSRRSRLLLPTIVQLFNTTQFASSAHYQCVKQESFI